MAQNITLMGANYSAVPAVTLPKTGGGTASFTDVTDTTAAAADVASGKYFYTASGVRTQGTNSGGGGGATNVVLGEFTVPAYSSSAPRGTVSIPYTGEGYPVAAMIYVKNGAYNSEGASTWYNGIKRYAIGFLAFSKSDTTTAPKFTGSSADTAVLTVVYKNSTSSATTYTRTSSMMCSMFSTGNPPSNSAFCVHFKNNVKTLVYSIANGTASTYGLYPEVTYVYHIIYSE